MARKKFHFDFNEDADPVDELHRRRVAMAEHFKTTEAIMEYLRTIPTAEEFLAGLDAEKATGRRKTQPAGQTVGSPRRGKRKAAKRPVHGSV